MKVLVDTSVWSVALRRKARPAEGADLAVLRELTELIQEGRVQMIGPIRQELLSGLKHEQDYARLREHLRAFPDEPLNTADYEEAARVANRCNKTGISGSAIDFLICAAAMERGWEVCTRDLDFQRYAKAVPLRLRVPG